MKYFLHDSNAFNDEKITQVFIKFGYEGLGLFYTILEKLALQEKPVLTDVLKHQLKIGKKLNKIWCFMEEIEIISSNNGETFNKQLLNFSEKYQIKKQKNAKRISEWRKNQEDSENVTRYEHVCNTPKDKISKVKESKEEENIKDNASGGKSFESKYKYFIELFNKLANRDFRGDVKSKGQLKARIKEGYSSDDFSKAIKNALDDQYHKETMFKYLTPEYITRGNQLEKYMNISKPEFKPIEDLPY